MTTIISSPASSNNSDSGMGFLIGIITLLLIGATTVYYRVPYFRQLSNQGVQVNIPKDINVQVQQPK